MNAIEMKGLTKNYGRHRGIKDITLAVEEGDIFGYLGPNGAGKSTSIRCLLGMISHSGGEAYLLGRRAGGKRAWETMRRVGYMPSEAHFYPSMRAGEVIRYAARLRGMDCGAEAERLCGRLQVDSHKRIQELSLGNRKKISIVCALQHRPDLVILDEPTSGLDPLMQEVFFELLLERNREGMTCFLSSHVLSEVNRYCRHVGILREGELVRTDTVENLTGADAARGQVLRRIRLMCAGELPKLAGISEAERSKDMVSFCWRGEMGELLRALQGLEVRDLLISEPSLEEIFMQYYTPAAGGEVRG